MRKPRPQFHREVINSGAVDYDAWNERYLQTLDDLNSIDYRLNSLATKTLSAAKQIKEREEWWLRIFTPASYVLYVQGWLLGVMSKLTGIDTSSAD